VSVSILIANFSKYEYFDGLPFGEEISDKNFIQGFNSIALSMLICDVSRSVYLIPPAGSWIGDHVAAIADVGLPDAEGFITRTDQEPERNLYAMVWQEYRDINLEVVAMVCDRLQEVAEELARRAQEELSSGTESKFRIWNLGQVVSVTKCDALDGALRRHIGEQWTQIYEESKHKYGNTH
jgi:hypothetical protein